MLSVEEYLDKVLALADLVPSSVEPIGGGFGRILAEDLFARYPVPPFTNSAMDGFAVRAADLGIGPTRLEVVGDIPAGAQDAPPVGAGEAVRIMTGAPLPRGADTVIPVELSDQAAGDVPLPRSVVVNPLPRGGNVRHRGEDVAVGAKVLRAGASWTPAAAAAAASVGYSEVPLRRRPRVAVLATGSELVSPGAQLGFGQIPDSNSILLAGLVEQFGGEVVLTTAVPDSVSQFEDSLDRAASLGADLIVTAGAISAGAFEVVRQSLEGKVSFNKVAMQPGKPQACGMLTLQGRPTAFVGLPGNPVSVFVSAWVFLRPLLARFQGAEAAWQAVELPTEEGWKSPSGRRQFVPVIIDNGAVSRIHHLGSGSHLIASTHLANALAVVPAEVSAVAPSDMLKVYPVR
ncbi:gephyrin-like molybdotransferase Glp [Schaalia sp. JY-X169]|uniref:molybdopterin molybdotransferase MoeA n=1 Tax=Schaalia sp. JY-X169 TaxID=2758572 RepID=UPI0015F46015|nr:gephyrin-like molybdotransferase Glp [Schaalia sp. JY-X169]